MTVWIIVQQVEIAALNQLGAPHPRSLWARRGFVAVFSCNETSVWRTPANGKTTRQNFPGDLTRECGLLDRVIGQIRAIKAGGGRLLVAPEGVYADVDGARELCVGFIYLEHALSTAMQPDVSP